MVRGINSFREWFSGCMRRMDIPIHVMQKYAVEHGISEAELRKIMQGAN